MFMQPFFVYNLNTGYILHMYLNNSWHITYEYNRLYRNIMNVVYNITTVLYNMLHNQHIVEDT